jgi:hypothetical protein
MNNCVSVCTESTTDVILRPATLDLTLHDHLQAEGSITWRADQLGSAPILASVRFRDDLPARL